jgi:hypothetical protein
MGFLASIFDPHVYGVNCTCGEWREFLQQAILGALEDEVEWGHYEFNWTEFSRDFPQLTLREFVAACGEVAQRPTLVAT